MTDLAMRAAQRSDLSARTTDTLVERLAEKYRDRITGYFRLPAILASHVPFPQGLSAGVQKSLKLHTHLSQAVATS